MTLYSLRPLLAKLCLLQLCLFLGTTTRGLAQDGSKFELAPRKESGQLPRVPTVESMLRPDALVERFLSRTPSESAYEKASFPVENRNRTYDREVQWDSSMAGWTSPEFYTRPLYFEQPHFERYASSTPEWTRPAISYIQFLGTIPVLPYKIGANGPRDRMYTAGHYPYDQIAPAHSSWGKLSKRGMLLQGVATTGLIFFIP